MKSSVVRSACAPRFCRLTGLFLAAIAIFGSSACKRSEPAPRVEQAPIPVKGTEHFEWDQLPLAGGKIEEYEFVAYVDDDPQALVDSVCRAAPDSGQFRCTAKLPLMTPGRHRLQVAASIMGKSERIESRKSAQLDLMVAPGADRAK